MWPYRYYTPDTGDEYDDDINRGKNVVAQAKLDRREQDVGDDIDPKRKCHDQADRTGHV